MPTYTVTDPDSGRKLRLTGDAPPTEQELEEVFASLGQPGMATATPTGADQVASIDSNVQGRYSPRLPRSSAHSDLPPSVPSPDDADRLAQSFDGLGKSIKRGAGLAIRNVVEGAGAIPIALTDAAGELVYGDQYRPISETLTDAGLPVPETASERLVSATGEGAAAVGSGLGVGRVLMDVGRGTTRAVGRFLTENPLAQLAAGAGAGSSGQAAAEVTDNPLVQLGASIVGGGVTGAAAMSRRSPIQRPRIEPTISEATVDAARLDATARQAATQIGIDWGALDDAMKTRIRRTIARAQQTADLPPEAAARAAFYESLGITPTRGMATRQLGDARNEQVLMQQPEGSALRDVYADNNEAIRQQIRSLAPEGVQPTDAPTFGQRFREPIARNERRAQQVTNEAYKRAEAAEGGNVTTVQPLVDHLQQNLPMLEATDAAKPVIAYLRQQGVISPANMELIATPGATQPVGLGHRALDLNLKELAGLRRVVNQAWTGATKRGDDLAAAQLNQVRSLVDEAEAAAGGDLYKAYRKLRVKKGQLYEDNPLIDQLISDRKGYRGTDLIEDSQVFDRAVLNSTTEQFAKVWPRLRQDAKDLTRAQVAKYIEERAFSNMGSNERGDVVASAAKLGQALNNINPEKLRLIYGADKAKQLQSLSTALREISNPVRGSVPAGSAPMLDHLARGLFSVLKGIPLANVPAEQIGNAVTSRRNAAAVQDALDFIPRQVQPPREPISNRLLMLAAPTAAGAIAAQE